MLTDGSKASDGSNSDMQNKKPKILKHFIDFSITLGKRKKTYAKVAKIQE